VTCQLLHSCLGAIKVGADQQRVVVAHEYSLGVCAHCLRHTIVYSCLYTVDCIQLQLHCSTLIQCCRLVPGPFTSSPHKQQQHNLPANDMIWRLTS
jgi:hypothetical protein